MIVKAIRGIGAGILDAVSGSGYSLNLLGRTCLWMLDPRQLMKRSGDIVRQAAVCGVESLPVTMIVALFSGFLLALSTGLELQKYGQAQVVGALLAVVMCREFGPFMTGLICAANVGSSMAAEIGTMKVSEEIDALEVMSVDPARYLVLPRVIAMTIMCPMLTIFSNIVGILGGAIIAMSQLNVSWRLYMLSVDEALNLKDIYTGLLKSVIFGIMISLIGCSQGLRATGGAIGVGLATRRSVIYSFVMIIIIGYFGTAIFHGKAMQ
jgi:phospholipid/cholesterol/gamma-HCH transport system permease protein